MDTKTEELAALYVMDLLQGSELEAFERRLHEDEPLNQLVRELSSGLHAPLKQFNGPERMDLLAGIHDKIGSPQPHLATAAARSATARIPGWVWGLGVAAAIMLGMNIFLLLNSRNSGLEAELLASRQSEKALLEENTAMKAFNKSWETEYMNLAERMLPFIGSRDGLGEFTVVDLVGVRSGSDASGPASNGNVGDYFISRSPLQFASVNASVLPQSKANASMGYAVWKADEGMGYLDLYNLPQPGADRAPFLWLRDQSGGDYFPVGFLPVLQNGTGTFYFEVDRADFRPNEVLITEESVEDPGDQPSRHHLMVGP